MPTYPGLTESVVLSEPIRFLGKFGNEYSIKIALEKRQIYKSTWEELYDSNFELMIRFIKEGKWNKDNYPNIRSIKDQDHIDKIIQTLFDLGYRDIYGMNVSLAIDYYVDRKSKIDLYTFLSIVCVSSLYSSKNLIMDQFNKYHSAKNFEMCKQISLCLEKMREQKNYILWFHKK